MKKKLSLILLLSIVLFAQKEDTNTLSSSEKIMVKKSNNTMKNMDKTHEEIIRISKVIDKTKLSIDKTFEEIEKIVNGYECEKFKVALDMFAGDIYMLGKEDKDVEAKKVILKKLESKRNSKCKGK